MKITLQMSSSIYGQIVTHLESVFPKEGAGLLLGRFNGHQRLVSKIMTFPNRFSPDEQHNRYLLTAADMLIGEDVAEKNSIEVIGVFHSHPDHPSRPSEYDREHALPWYSYLIVSVHAKGAGDARSWILSDDRTQFIEQIIRIEEDPETAGITN